MQKIKSAAIKAAALVHSQKQLRVLLGSDAVMSGAGTVTFGGEIAYAQWQMSIDKSKVIAYRINYPAMPDNSYVSRQEADLIAAYTGHELGHVAFTDNTALNRYSSPQHALICKLWNGIEDARIEHAMIVSGRANGLRSGFKRLMSHYTSKLDASFNPASINSAPFALALICRAAYGDGNGFAKSLLARIPEPKRSLYKAVADAMPSLSLDRDGTGQALGLAVKFLEGWKQLEDVNQEHEPERMPWQQPQQQEQQQDSGDSDESDESDAGDSGEDGEDELAEADSDIANTVEAGDDSEVSMSGAGDSDDSDGDDACGTGSGDEPFEDKTEQYDEQLCKSPEPDIGEVFKRVRERVPFSIELPVAPAPGRSEMRKWSSMQKDEASLRRAARTLSKAVLPALKSRLYQILKAPERCGWDSGAVSGRFDGRRAPRMFSGSESVFKRRWESEGIHTSVSVLVDLSGSMNGPYAKTSAHLAWTIAQAAEAAGAECEVAGFRSPSTYDHVQMTSGRDMFGDIKTTESREVRNGVLVVAKRFEDRTASIPHHFVKMGQIANGGTPDYTCLRAVVQQLSQRKAGRRIVIVITDGFGEAKKVRLLTRTSKAMFDVEVVAFGIGTFDEALAEAYEIGAAVRRVDDLHSIALRKVIDQLKAADHRRVA